jgi:hypothetical protein
MSKSLSMMSAITIAAVAQFGCAGAEPTEDEVIEQVYAGKLTLSQAQAACRCRLETVPIGGTVFHFGLDLTQSPPVFFPFQSTIAGARVSVAELPITKLLNIRSNSDGKWSFTAIKIKGTPLRASFVYELEGYQTTKSQVFEIGGDGITDIAAQVPTAAYFGLAKAAIEQQIAAIIGAPYTLNNVLVTTVGKSWASMYNPVTPHGDPGVQVAIDPPTQFPLSVGPLYFNEDVVVDATLTATSVDGGVFFGNLPRGRHQITASKAPFSYDALTFSVQDGIALYVASPPHATQGTNDSPAGAP